LRDGGGSLPAGRNQALPGDPGASHRLRPPLVDRPPSGDGRGDPSIGVPGTACWVLFLGPLVQQQNAGPAHRRSGCNSPEVHHPSLGGAKRRPSEGGHRHATDGKPAARLNVGIRAVRKTAALEDRRFDSSRADQTSVRAHGKTAFRLRPFRRGLRRTSPPRPARRSSSPSERRRMPDQGRVGQRQTVIPTRSRCWFDSSRAHQTHFGLPIQSSIPSASSHKQQCSGFISRPSRCESGGSHGRFGHAAGPPRSKRDRRREPSWEFDSPTFLSGEVRRTVSHPVANGTPSGACRFDSCPLLVPGRVANQQTRRSAKPPERGRHPPRPSFISRRRSTADCLFRKQAMWVRLPPSALNPCGVG
jgi:hypothetical protein